MSTVKETEVMDRYRKKSSGWYKLETTTQYLVVGAVIFAFIGVGIWIAVIRGNLFNFNGKMFTVQIAFDLFLKSIAVVTITIGLAGFVYGLLAEHAHDFLLNYVLVFSAGLALYSQSGWAILSMTLLFIVVLLPDIYAKIVEQQSADSRTE